MDASNYAPISPRMQNTQLVQNDYQWQIMSVVICLIIFQSSYERSVIMKVKILKIVKWSYRSPYLC